MSFVTDYSGIPYEIKDPAETIDYTIDWSAWLAGKNNDTIASVAWTVNGVTLVSQSHTTTSATIFVSGGVLGVTATVQCTITTANARIEPRTFNLRLQTK